MKGVLIVIFAGLVLSSEAGNLPSYLSQCCASDPDAKKCYLEQAKLIIPLMLSGDKYYNVVSLLPYREAQRVMLNNDDGIFVLYTMRLWGLDSTDLLNFTVDFDAGSGMCQYHIYRLRLQFTYNIHIFNTALVAYGKGEMYIDDMFLSHSLKFALDREQYAHVTDASVSFTASNIAYNLDNLSEEANEYLQDNVDQLNELFEPNLRRLLSAVLTSPLRSYAELIKLDCAIGFGKDCK